MEPLTSLRLTRELTGPRAPSLLARLPSHLALRYPHVVSDREAESLVRSILLGRDEWIPNFGGVQFTLGRAWYTHHEEDREGEYFANAAASDESVERWAPGLRARLMGAIRRLVGGRVEPRWGWCGPGVHIFPAGSEVARRGGEVHSDHEGLREDELDRRALTFVLVLQTPTSGGGLAVWDGDHREDLEYEVGELVVIDSHRSHRILPFEGNRDRITATVHLVETDDGWESWF